MNRYTFFVGLLTCFLYFMKNADTKPLLRNEIYKLLRQDIKRLAANFKHEQKRFKNHEEQNEEKRQHKSNDNSVDNEDEPSVIYNFEDIMANMAHEDEQAINNVFGPDFEAQVEHAVPNDPGDEHADGIMIGIMEDEHENGSTVMNYLENVHRIILDMMASMAEDVPAVRNMLENNFDAKIITYMDILVHLFGDEPAVWNNPENVHHLIMNLMASMAENMLDNNFESRLNMYMRILDNLLRPEPNPDNEPPMWDLPEED